MSTDKEATLEAEWRAIILSKLTSMEEGMKGMQEDINSIKESFVRQGVLNDYRAEQKLEIDQLKAKIEVLETSKTKVLGIMAGISVVISLAGWVLGLVVLWASGHPL